MTNAVAQRNSRSAMVTVAAVVEETAEARSLVFDVPADRSDDFRYKPGQFLTLRIPSDQTGSVARCYSLASSPLTDARPKVTVKRTDGGYGSHWLCDNVNVGDVLEVTFKFFGRDLGSEQSSRSRLAKRLERPLVGSTLDGA